MIRNNTKVYLIKWHQVARANSIEQGLAPQINNANRATRASSPDWKCGTSLQFRLARARNCTTRCDEVAEDNGSHDEDRYRADL